MIDLILTCAPDVAPQTVQEIIRVESGGNPLAININGASLARPAIDVADAVKLASSAMAAGHTVDLGLMQVNSANLPKLGYTVEQMFDSCTNLKAGAAILTVNYGRAVERHGPGQEALKAALSAYNTGSFERGFRNGYVARYYGAGVTFAAGAASGDAAPSRQLLPPPAPEAAPADPYHADTTAYRRTTNVQQQLDHGGTAPGRQ